MKYRTISKKTQKQNFPSNEICNMKYRWYSILFWVTVQQFELFFNVYFFIISTTQCIERFAISSPITSLGPWLLVFFISLSKEVYDDFKRNERDVVINNKLYTTYSQNVFYKKRSKDIKIGDLIILEKDERVPADMVILKTADSTGQLFIRTDQLDGETDWKLRSSVGITQKCDLSELEDFTILAEEPNKDIYQFNGSISKNEAFLINEIKEETYNFGFFSKLKHLFDKKNEEVIPLSSTDSVDWLIENKNTDLEEEMMKTVEIKKYQENKNELDDNFLCKNDKIIDLKKVSIIQSGTSSLQTKSLSIAGLSLENMIWMNTVIATCSVVGCVVYTGNDTKAMINTSKPRNKIGQFDLELDMYSKFLGITSAVVAGVFAYMKGFNSNSLVAYVRFLVLFSSVIPLSLKVTIDMARYVYSYFIANDKIILNTIVRNSSLPEELGRISYFLTDKTGTLTKNEMEMKKIHLGTICYTQDLNEEITKKMARFLSNRTKDINIFNRNKRDINNRLFELIEGLCVCHNVTPVINDQKIVYQASSPDEIAIVKWTESIGMKLFKRNKTSITILDPLNDEKVYEILYIFPFTSETKRMGIIVKYENQIMFFMKGADVVMNRIVQPTDWTDEETENMARDGLRTLIIGKKVLSNEEFSNFEKKYEKAKTSLENRSNKITEAMSLIECNLTVLGLTGVEDKLQDNVKVTLENLKNGGMKIWMLTGDKIETAISIAISSKIFDRNTDYKIISNTTDLETIKTFFNEIKRFNMDALVVDGVSLSTIMEECFDEFIDLSMELKGVIGCRFSPTQKALVARALRLRSKKIVCCIGDGGNDVSMITEANLGIGIVGKEGNQASLAADYSIEKFCYVTELFYWHGRNSYKNSATIANLIIHRGIILSVLQGLFCALINFIPFNLYVGIIMIAFVSIYTFFPIFSSVFTTDVSREVTQMFPELYKELVEQTLLSIKEFTSWNLMSFIQGTIIMFAMVWYFDKELFSIRTLTFSCLIINEIFMVFLANTKITKQMMLACSLSLFIYLLSFFVLKNTLSIDSFIHIFILKVSVVNCIAILPMLIRLAIEAYRPSTGSKLEKI